MADRSSEAVSFARFSALARRIADQSRGLGLVPPSFRTPPKVAGVTRTLRRRPDGTVTVAVAVQGRPVRAVVTDLVDGVLAANRLAGPDAERARAALLVAVNVSARSRAA